MTAAAILLNATLFGGMMFYSFGFAPVLFKQLPTEKVRALLRGTFPYYYLVVIVLSASAGLSALLTSVSAAMLVGAIFLSTLFARQILMPQINSASDSGNQASFKKLHGLSVVIQLIQIGISGWALILITG